MKNKINKKIYIKKLHHSAYRCSDSEKTRKFYEDFLGLPLVKSLELNKTKTERKSKVLHTFYAMNDASYLAFFEAPDLHFEFKKQHDFDLHIALEVSKKVMLEFYNKAIKKGIEVRGVSDHGFIESIYLRDPDGYVVELTCIKNTETNDVENPYKVLNRWKNKK